MTEIKIISGYIFYGLAFVVIAYNLMLKYSAWREGQYRSWIFVVATIFAFVATVSPGGNWWIFLTIVAADWLPPFFLVKRQP